MSRDKKQPITEDDKDKQIPALTISTVLLKDENLTAMEMLILSEISALDNDDHCIATAEYLAKFIHTSARTVRRVVGSLEDKGYIKVFRSWKFGDKGIKSPWTISVNAISHRKHKERGQNVLVSGEQRGQNGPVNGAKMAQSRGQIGRHIGKPIKITEHKKRDDSLELSISENREEEEPVEKDVEGEEFPGYPNYESHDYDYEAQPHLAGPEPTTKLIKGVVHDKWNGTWLPRVNHIEDLPETTLDTGEY